MRFGSTPVRGMRQAAHGRHRTMNDEVLARNQTAETRAALETQALRLVAQNGMETTTAASIAQAAGVTERTFFRYYASKEEVILGYVIERISEVLAKLGTHCTDRVTIHCLIDAFQSHATELVEDDEFVRRIRIINADPRLREQMHVERLKLQERLSAGIAQHENQKLSLRSDVLARTAVAIVTAGTEAWTGTPHAKPVARYIDDAARTILQPDV